MAHLLKQIKTKNKQTNKIIVAAATATPFTDIFANNKYFSTPIIRIKNNYYGRKYFSNNNNNANNNIFVPIEYKDTGNNEMNKCKGCFVTLARINDEDAKAKYLSNISLKQRQKLRRCSVLIPNIHKLKGDNKNVFVRSVSQDRSELLSKINKRQDGKMCISPNNSIILYEKEHLSPQSEKDLMCVNKGILSIKGEMRPVKFIEPYQQVNRSDTIGYKSSEEESTEVTKLCDVTKTFQSCLLYTSDAADE